MLSLRQRAWISGGLSALVSVIVGVLLLYSYLNQRGLDRFDRALVERHTQVVVALSYAPEDPAELAQLLFDPQYEAPFSGRYWQITASDGQVYSSGSLLGASLPVGETAQAGLQLRDAVDPDIEEVRIATQQITLENGSTWVVAVAESLAQLKADRRDLRQSLGAAFALVAMIGLASVLAQTTAILRPLDRLRRDVAHRWDREEALSEADYPEEVAPLVGDINTLLERNREIVSRSRRQAADLAHALKTPSAILRNELTTLAETSRDVVTALDALDRVDAQLARSLARLRTANTGEAAQAKTDLSRAIDRFGRLFGMMAGREGKACTVSCEPDLVVRMDAQDLDEVLGNLLDNALKWSRSQLRLTARPNDGGVEIAVEDDGPGIPAEGRADAVRSGTRLDSSKPGTGLGLAIASDLLQAYGSALVLEDSAELGGLSVRFTLPSLRRERAKKG